MWVWHLSGLMCVKRVLSVLLFGWTAARPKAYYYAVDHGNLLELWETETQTKKLRESPDVLSMLTVLTMSGLVFQMATGEKLRNHKTSFTALEPIFGSQKHSLGWGWFVVWVRQWLHPQLFFLANDPPHNHPAFCFHLFVYFWSTNGLGLRPLNLSCTCALWWPWDSFLVILQVAYRTSQHSCCFTGRYSNVSRFGFDLGD